jgi:hypothetical protein
VVTAIRSLSKFCAATYTPDLFQCNHIVLVNAIVSSLLLLTFEAHVVWMTLDLRVRIGVLPETKIHDNISSQAHLSGSPEVSCSILFFSRKCLFAQDTF